jgi:hypothetical protein
MAAPRAASLANTTGSVGLCGASVLTSAQPGAACLLSEDGGGSSVWFAVNALVTGFDDSGARPIDTSGADGKASAFFLRRCDFSLQLAEQ